MITRYKRLLDGASPAQVIWGMMPTTNPMVYGKGEEVPEGCTISSTRPDSWGTEYRFFAKCTSGC